MSAFDDFLADPSAERCWLLEIDGFLLTPDTDGTQAAGAFSEAAFSEVAFSDDNGSASISTTLYYSSHGFTTAPADSPASQYYDARLRSDLAIDRQMFGQAGIGGLTRVQADLALANGDGALDTLQATYALDGRAVRIYIGRPTDARSAFNLMFSGVIDTVDTGNASIVRFRLSDGIARLDRPMNPVTYAGTGGLEGGTDLTGKPKPKAFGNCPNVSALLVDSANLIYQVHDALVSDVPAVYDRGVSLTRGADYASLTEITTTAPAAGNYRVWNSSSGTYFRLGSTPSGTVTADVLGDATGGYVNKTGDILQRVILVAGIDATLVDSAAFTQLNTDAPAEVGIWIGANQVTVATVANQILAGAGAFGGFSRAGLFTAAVIKAAAGSPVASFTEQDIASVVRVPLPPAVDPAVWRVRVAWQRNYTVQADLAAAVSAARRTFAAQDQRVSVKDDVTTKSQHLLAQEYGPTGNLYAQQADADTEALRVLALWKGAPSFYEVKLKPRGLGRDLGDEVNLTYGRYGFSAGKNARILAHSIRGTSAQVTVLA